MKTIKDIENMKLNKGMFGTQFNGLIADLENDYISKYNGKERIRSKLQEWDNEAKEYIINTLIEILKSGFLIDFNPNDLLDVLKKQM